MASKNTSGAVHMTSLDLDMSKAYNSLRTFENQFNNTVARMKGQVVTPNMGQNTAQMKQQQSVIAASEKAIADLQLQYANLEKTMSRFGTSKNLASFAEIKTAIEKASNALAGYRNTIQSGKSLEDDQIRDINEFSIQLKDLQRSLADTEKEYANLDKVMKPTTESINRLKNGFQELINKISTGKLNTPELQSLKQNLEANLGTLQKAAAEFKNTGTATQETADIIRNLQIALANANVEYGNVSREARAANRAMKEQQAAEKTIGNLQQKLEQLRRTISTSKIPKNYFDDFATGIQAAASKLNDLSNSMQGNSAISKEQRDALKGTETEIKNLDTRLSNMIADYKEYNRATTPTIESTNRLKNSLKNLISDLGKSNLNTPEIQSMKRNLEDARVSVEGLLQAFSTGKPITTEMAEAFRTAGLVLGDMRTRFRELNNEAQAAGNAQKATAQSVQELMQKYSAFYSSLKGGAVQTPAMQQLQAQVKLTLEELAKLTVAVNKDANAASGMSKRYAELIEQLTRYRTQAELIKASAYTQEQEFKKLSQSIKSAVSDLKELEKSATFRGSKQQATQLREQFQSLAREIKNSSISAQDAQRRYDELNARLQRLTETTRTGTNVFTRFVDALANRAKWMIASTMLNKLFTSFTDTINVIKETEDAVIALQRVLNTDVSNSEMSAGLYDIAYRYGQTFDNVQQSATLFAQTGMTWKETLEATEAAMLALNTAELEVSESTQGIIAIMQQFDYETEDLELIIDKINITADNFAVTSEKIVAALQRAGGTAKAYGLTLEETIGIITALSEATGRSGENIGTALNSLISFSMNKSALETFEQYIGEIDTTSMSVLDIWEKLSVAIKGNEEEIATALASNSQFANLFTEEMATAIGLTDEYTKATEEANETIARGEDIYASVGVYRKNYFIALLNNFDTVREAIENMRDAEGYSQAENERAMEALTKKVNQLIASARELAVQFGEMGALDAMKWIVDGATAVLKLTKNIGGLTTALFALSTAISIVKKKQIADTFINIKTSVVGAAEAVKNFVASVGRISTAFTQNLRHTKSLSSALDAAALSAKRAGVQISAFSATLIGLTVAFAAFNVIKGVIDRMEEMRQATIDAGAEAGEQIKTLSGLSEAYQDARNAMDGSVESREAYLQSAADLADALGIESYVVDALKDNYEELDNLIKESLNEEYIDNMTDQLLAVQELREKMESPLTFDVWKEVDFSNGTTRILEAVNGVEDYITSLQGVKKQMKDLLSTGKPLENWQKDYLEDLKTQKAALEEVVNPYIEYVVQLAKAEEQYRAMTGMPSSAAEEINGYITELENLNAITPETADNLRAAIGNFEDIADAAGTATERMSELNDKIDGFQSSYSTLKSIVDEYNETGVMTVDMYQQLMELGPEYLALLENEGGQLSINQAGLEDMMAVQGNYLIQMTAIKFAKDAETIATKAQAYANGELTESEYNAFVQSMALSGELETLAYKFFAGEASADELSGACQNLAAKFDLAGEHANMLTNTLITQATQMQSNLNLMGQITSYDLGRYETKNGTIYSGTEVAQRAKALGMTVEAFKKQLGLKEIPTVTTSGTQYVTGSGSGSSGKSSSGSSGSSTKSKTAAELLEEKIKAAKDEFNEFIAIYEHKIDLLEFNGAPFEDIVKVYDKLMDASHAQAEKYRAMGVDEDSEYIRDLQSKWWKYHEAKMQLYEDDYKARQKMHDNALDLMDEQYNRAMEKLDYSDANKITLKSIEEVKKSMDDAHQEANRLRALGYEDTDDVIVACKKEWDDGYNTLREYFDKIKDDMLDVYDEAIDLIDAFDVWDSMDFTKVDMLQDKLDDINGLYRDGIITLQQYKELVQDVGVDIYNAASDLYSKRKDEIEDYYDGIVKGMENRIKGLEDEKDSIQEYYDAIKANYEAEIEEIEKRKEESDEYYEKLIENLQKVEEENDRINQQLDYYNERQKIMTNLEQAESRSGLEWRQKEMEYQQEAIDLDEEWRRTQQQWAIEDQIEALQRLQEMAAAQFEAQIEQINQYIETVTKQCEAEVQAIEDAIAGIEDEIEAAEAAAENALAALDADIEQLKLQLYNAVADGTAQGLEGASAAIDEALNGFSDTIGDRAKVIGSEFKSYIFDDPFYEGSEAAEEAITNIGDKWLNISTYMRDATQTNFVNPLVSDIGSISNQMQTQLVSAGEETANKLNQAFTNNFISPIKQQLNQIMSEAMNNANSVQRQMASSIAVSRDGTVTTNNTTATMYANIATPGAATQTVNSWSSFFNSPRRI